MDVILMERQQLKGLRENTIGAIIPSGDG
jgi:hypothetical protein